MTKALWELWDEDFDNNLWYRCSHCEEIFLFEMKNDKRYKFCPNCGKDMEYLEED